MASRQPELAIPSGVSPSQAFVHILDPATGTGTFLVEVIDLVHRTLVTKWTAQGRSAAAIESLWNAYVPEHLLPRLCGFELLMAPYVIAHLKVGLKLLETGYRFDNAAQVRVFLTNSLEPPQDFPGRLAFAVPALAHEARAVNEIKTAQRFTVVVGNPPYSNFGQLNRIPFILDLLQDYKRDLEEKKVNLDDDFIKFVRLGQYVIDTTGSGVLGFITNNTYLDGPTRRGMRRSLTSDFSEIRVLDLHGNSIEREVAPDGTADENVFDIQQGVAIGIFVKRGRAPEAALQRADLYGKRDAKYEALSAANQAQIKWSYVTPSEPLFRFELQDGLTAEYANYVPLTSVLTLAGSGVKTDRDSLCFDFDHEVLAARMKEAFSGHYGADFAEDFGIFDSTSYNLTQRLSQLSYDRTAIRACLYRPFDRRSLYYQPGFTSRPAWRVMRHMVQRNLGLLAKRQARDGSYDWFFVADGLVVDGLFSIDNKGREQLFPLLQYPDPTSPQLMFGEISPSHNFGAGFLRGVCIALGLPQDPTGLPVGVSAEQIFGYVYAVVHSPTYRLRYEGLLKQDYPRVPLPRDFSLFQDLSEAGSELVALHLMSHMEVADQSPEFVGGTTRHVEFVSFDGDAVWIDRARTTGFVGVPDAVWEFRIGGHQVCEKWLKDRKGRVLTDDDIAHYKGIAVALSETIRLMGEIDVSIDLWGGWPGAFAGGTTPL